MTIDTKHFKEKLEEELSLVTEELESVGKINPDNPNDWIPKPTEMDTRSADSNDVADGYEAYEENEGILNELEKRWNLIKNALKRIENDSYGFCKVCNEPIETDRLEANPAAETCKKHLEEK